MIRWRPRPGDTGPFVPKIQASVAAVFCGSKQRLKVDQRLTRKISGIKKAQHFYVRL